MHPATSSRANNLSSIDLLVLFDLLGTSRPRIPSYFPTTHWAYRSMWKIERRLRDQGHMLTSKGENWLYEGEQYNKVMYKGGIEDDHIPFLQRGVEILHIIPVVPFLALIKDPIPYSMAYKRRTSPPGILIPGRRGSFRLEYSLRLGPDRNAIYRGVYGTRHRSGGSHRRAGALGCA